MKATICEYWKALLMKAAAREPFLPKGGLPTVIISLGGEGGRYSERSAERKSALMISGTRESISQAKEPGLWKLVELERARRKAPSPADGSRKK